MQDGKIRRWGRCLSQPARNRQRPDRRQRSEAANSGAKARALKPAPYRALPS